MREQLIPFNEKMEKTLAVLAEDYASIRAGRANPGVLDRISVEYYGAMTPINQMAAISVAEARILVIQPWDRSSLKSIEKAINASDIGIPPQNDGSCIRLVFPPLTEERRKEIVKEVRKTAEDNKVAVRNTRRDAIEKLKALKKSNTDIQGVVMRTCPIYTKDYLVNLHSKIYDEKEGCAFIYGYGDYGYSFTCLFNLVDFIAALLNLNSSSNYQGIYNICDSKPIQAKDIVEYERSNHLLGTSGIVMQRNYGADSVKTSVFGLLGNKAAKTDYRYNDLSVACSNISYDNTKAQRISSFRWKLSNTK